jgi:hypothetical protein
MSSSKKIDLYKDFAAGVYLPEVQSPIPPLPHYIRYAVQYTYSHRERGRRGELNHRKGRRGNSSLKKFLDDDIDRIYPLWHVNSSTSFSRHYPFHQLTQTQSQIK